MFSSVFSDERNTKITVSSTQNIVNSSTVSIN